MRTPRRWRRIAALGVCALGGALLAAYLWWRAAPVSREVAVPRLAASSLAWADAHGKEGDLVFRTGRDVMARLVLTQGDSVRYSHVGVLVGSAGKWSVVSSMPAEGAFRGGVATEPLALFAGREKARAVGFWRVGALSPQAREVFVAHVLAQRGRPFDAGFRYGEDSGLYCTELVMKGLAAAGQDLSDSVEGVTVPTVPEKVYPPDYLRRSGRLGRMWAAQEREGP